MEENFTKALRQIAEAAGWRLPDVNEKGEARVLLDDGLDLCFSSPDDLFLILYSDLGEAPSPETYEGGERLREIGKRAAAYQRTAVSALSLSEGRLELTARLPLDADTERLTELVRRFLNDEAYWRENLDEGNASAFGASPFSFPMGAADWFASQNRF